MRISKSFLLLSGAQFSQFEQGEPSPRRFEKDCRVQQPTRNTLPTATQVIVEPSPPYENFILGTTRVIGHGERLVSRVSRE